MEETGHQVSVHEFLGSMSYAVDGNIKIVQFWHMRAVRGPVRELTYDIKAVKWLSLKQAIDTLTRAHEKVFLANVGPIALKAAKQSARDKSTRRSVRNGGRRRDQSAPGPLAEYSFCGRLERASIRRRCVGSRRLLPGFLAPNVLIGPPHRAGS